MNNIDKAKELVEKLKIEKEKWNNKIYGVGETRVDLMIDDVIRIIKNQQSELETWKKIAEKLAEEVDRLEEVLIDNNVEFNRFERCQFKDLKCMDMNIECEDCIIDWARKEVEKDV